MNTLTFGSLFAGIGGIDLGLERAKMQCKWQVEIDDYATKVLAKHWLEAADEIKRWRSIYLQLERLKSISTQNFTTYRDNI